MFDVRDHLDGLRCRETEWLLAERVRVIREKRRLEVRELALTKVLDERGALGADLAGRDGVSARTVRTMLDTARRLEAVPEVVAAAWDGRLSAEQLAPVVELADEDCDREWAVRAEHCSPADLARLARRKAVPSEAEGHRRRDARSLRMWWQHDTGMLSVRGELPDVDGAVFESVVNDLIDRMRPAQGEPWDTREHRGADALVALAAGFGDSDLPGRPRAHLVVHVPLEGPAEVAGIPLPAGMVEALRAQASIEPVAVDDQQVPVAAGRTRAALSPKIVRAVLLRDGHCRWPGCDRRTGLQIHHLTPVSWGGRDELANLAAVCTGGATDHHTRLAPHGPHLLTGNPNQPDGLRLTLPDHAHAKARAGARAGP
jgi:hypothetical protein